MTVSGALPVSDQAGVPDEFMTLSTEIKAPEFDLAKHIDSLTPKYWGPADFTLTDKQRYGEHFVNASVPNWVNPEETLYGFARQDIGASVAHAATHAFEAMSRRQAVGDSNANYSNHAVDVVKSLGLESDTAFDKWKHWQRSVDAGKPYVSCGRKAPYKKVYFYDPQPEDFDIEDIAFNLFRIRRFAGGPGLTVGHHSILMAMYASNPQIALQCLLHDATETIIGDIPSPVKACSAEIQAIEVRLLQVILQKFCGVSELDPEVHFLDNEAYLWEKIHIRKDRDSLTPSLMLSAMHRTYTEHEYLAMFRQYKELF